MRIAVIGAGAAGLISLKYALEEGYECDIFEQTGMIGGTWIYTDRVGLDDNGIAIHSSMYKGLITNLPKETMTYLDFPYPKQCKSYITHYEVLEYFNRFVNHFNLKKNIKFYERVIKVIPLPDNKWTITVKNVKRKIEESHNYDSVFVCTGHYSDPIIPNITGQDIFEGPQLHSRDYRIPEPYTNKKVLLIGAGYSGQDIAMLVAQVAKQVFLSFKDKKLLITPPRNLTLKTKVKNFKQNGAVFEDDTFEEVDAVVYCTGYKYSFPFLTKECGISVEDNCVRPLYKHIVNIEKPTMYFIGIPFLVSPIPMFDVQARFGLAALGGKLTLPPKETMMSILDGYLEDLKDRGISMKLAHRVGGTYENQQKYFDDLATTAGIQKMPPVLSRIYEMGKMKKYFNIYFKIIDDEKFEWHELDENCTG